MGGEAGPLTPGEDVLVHESRIYIVSSFVLRISSRIDLRMSLYFVLVLWSPVSDVIYGLGVRASMV